MEDCEKLGAFYLGKGFGLDAGEPTDDLILYDARDLTTHAICVGMTGSGKTGLCLTLLEEAAIDGIPAIAIDPKGDLGNLMLTFPQLLPEDFLPWVDQAEAHRKGMTPEAYAADRAALWKKGLGQWGQDGQRIGRFRDSADVTIYTPGSGAGLPLTVLGSLAAPTAEILADSDAFRERVEATVSGILALLGLQAEPLQSREHILLATLIDRTWRDGRSLDIAALIGAIQSPPFDKLGVLDIESFFPAKDRFKLAMSLNNLLASPGFAAWMEGESLDVARLLHTPQGKPRISIMSIAHLSEAERMFFVTILLNEVVAWMRSQPGTGSLRAILYMDEIFGYFPPTANPPSKTPMLTLLKQARAYGLGVVLATQNPVDLDYKGLANTGTWFIGRLQTERDKARLLDGLESASTGGAFNRGEIESILSRLDSRVFLMNNVHDDQPVLFQTRWALSYLRGPLTRTQIQELMASRKASAAATAKTAATQTVTPAAVLTDAAPAAETRTTQSPPTLPPGIEQRFIAVTRTVPATGRLQYEPALVGLAKLHYERKSANVDVWKDVALAAPLGEHESGNPWEEAESIDCAAADFDADPDDRGHYAALPALATRKESHAKWVKSFAGHVYRKYSGTVLKCVELKEYSELDENEADFRVRLRHAAHERRDMQLDRLRKRYAPKLTALEEQVRRANERVDREKSQMNQQGLQTAVSFGATILGALFGRKKASVANVGRAATTIRTAGRAAREHGDVSRAQENVESLNQRLADLETEFQAELEEVRLAADVDTLKFEEINVRPKKSDIAVDHCGLVWIPYLVDDDGLTKAAFGA